MTSDGPESPIAPSSGPDSTGGLDPATCMVGMIASTIVRAGEQVTLWQTVEGNALRIHLRAETHGATAALIGHKGAVITPILSLARFAARGRWRDVVIQIEKDHLPPRRGKEAT